MDRKEFLKVCGGSCLGLLGLSVLLDSCKSGQYVQGTVANNLLQINKGDFVVLKNDKTTYRRSIITKPENFNYPIVVYRFSETQYSALLLSCTHQSSELTMNGDILTCSAHGSEFSNKGEVLQGPAEQKLKSFNVTTDDKNIYIQLT